MTCGYLKPSQPLLEEQPKDDAFTEDGFFRTGDVVELQEDAKGRTMVRIIDRAKHLFKLSQGEHVSPERIEGVLQAQSCVDRIFVHGDSLQPFVVAVVLLKKWWLKEFILQRKQSSGLAPSKQPQLAGEQELSQEWQADDSRPASVEGEQHLHDTDVLLAFCEDGVVDEDAATAALNSDQELLQHVLNALGVAAHTAGLQGYEVPQAVHLTVTPFTQANGVVTPTNKLRRHPLRAKYAAALDECYATAHAKREEAEADLLRILRDALGARERGKTADSSNNEGGKDSGKHVETLGRGVGLASLGVDSMAAMRLQRTLAQEFRVELPLASLFSRPLDEILAMIRVAGPSAVQCHGVGSGSRDTSALCTRLESDIRQMGLLDEATLQQCTAAGGRWQPPDSANEDASVVLTGATGFLGRHLLLAILAHTRWRVVCIVRGEDGKGRLEGGVRAHGTEEEWGLWQAESVRVRVLEGDLSVPWMGLQEGDWEELAGGKVHLVLHNAARVNHMLPYEAMRRDNVEGTAQAVKVAAAAGCGLVYISTMSVTGLEEGRGEGGEVSRIGMVAVAEENGYAQSKWVAERVVAHAGAAGLPTWRLRVGSVAGHSITGSCSTSDFINCFLWGMVTLGVAPTRDCHKSERVELMAVDLVARGIVGLVSRGLAACDREQLYESPVHTLSAIREAPTLRQLVRWMRTFKGGEKASLERGACSGEVDGSGEVETTVAGVTFKHWRTKLQDWIEENRSHAEGGEAHTERVRMMEKLNAYFVGTERWAGKSEPGVDNAGWGLPKVDESYVHTLLNFLQNHLSMTPPL
eukprot:gene1758-2421_t